MASKRKSIGIKANIRTPKQSLSKTRASNIQKAVIIVHQLDASGLKDSTLRENVQRAATRGLKHRRTLMKKGTDSEKLVNLRFQPLFAD